MSGRRGADTTDPSDSEQAASSPAGRRGGGSPSSPTKWAGAAAASSMLLASDATAAQDDEDSRRLAAAATTGEGQGAGTLPHWIPNTLEDASTVHSTLASGGPGSFHGPEGKVTSCQTNDE